VEEGGDVKSLPFGDGRGQALSEVNGVTASEIDFDFSPVSLDFMNSSEGRFVEGKAHYG